MHLAHSLASKAQSSAMNLLLILFHPYPVPQIGGGSPPIKGYLAVVHYV